MDSTPVPKIFHYVYANVPNLIHTSEVRSSSGPTVHFRDSASIYTLGWLCGGLTVGGIYEGLALYESRACKAHSTVTICRHPLGCVYLCSPAEFRQMPL